jgi:hypothetical protein
VATSSADRSANLWGGTRDGRCRSRPADNPRGRLLPGPRAAAQPGGYRASRIAPNSRAILGTRPPWPLSAKAPPTLTGFRRLVLTLAEVAACRVETRTLAQRLPKCSYPVPIMQVGAYSRERSKNVETKWRRFLIRFGFCDRLFRYYRPVAPTPRA